MLSQNTYWEVSSHVPDNALQRGPASKNPLPQHPLLVSTNPVINHMHISQTLPSVLNHFTLLNHLIMREKKIIPYFCGLLIMSITGSNRFAYTNLLPGNDASN